MRDLYVILSVTGWVWCLFVAIFLWVRLRRHPRPHGTDATGGEAGGVNGGSSAAGPGAGGS